MGQQFDALKARLSEINNVYRAKCHSALGPADQNAGRRRTGARRAIGTLTTIGHSMAMSTETKRFAGSRGDRVPGPIVRKRRGRAWCESRSETSTS